MRIAVFNTKKYDREFLTAANAELGHELTFFEPRLTTETVSLAQGFPAVCIFVNDEAGAEVLDTLAAGGTTCIALRCSGFNNVDLHRAEELGIAVLRVPAYSPHAVAEHAVALLLSLNRKIYRSHMRVREGNFALDGLMGFDLHGRTVGVIGTGRIGQELSKILFGFGCTVIAYDVHENPACVEMGVTYMPLHDLFGQSDIVSLHCPLIPETYHLINDTAVAAMKPGITLINTSRGALIDTRAVIDGLKSGKIGYLGLDVYEEEADLFFEDLSSEVIHDDLFARLLTFPNVLVTGHQAYFTEEAVENIAQTTLANVRDYEQGGPTPNRLAPEKRRPHRG